jgi:chromosome segregation ATPase
MKKIFVGVVVFSALGGAMQAHAQGSSAPPQASLADQLESCRQNVVQLTEQSRGHRTKLASLRAERKTLGVSGGELVRYKLANLDQELRERSKQNQSIIAQIDSENKRCETLAARAAAGSRGTQAPPRERKP